MICKKKKLPQVTGAHENIPVSRGWGSGVGGYVYAVLEAEKIPSPSL